MSFRLIFHGTHPIISRLEIFYHLYAPMLSGYPMRDYEKWAMILTRQKAFWHFSKSGFKDLLQAMDKIAKKKPLDDKEWEAVLLAAQIELPEWARKELNRRTKYVEREWKKVRDVFVDVISSIHPGSLWKPVHVYTTFENTGHGGSGVSRDVLVMNLPVNRKFDSERARRVTKILIHEVIHIMHERDTTFNRFLRAYERKHHIPIHEAYTNALMDFTWWRAGQQEDMFAEYYEREWKDLCDVEDRMRKTIKNWWEHGGDLKKMIVEEFKDG